MELPKRAREAKGLVLRLLKLEIDREKRRELVTEAFSCFALPIEVYNAAAESTTSRGEAGYQSIRGYIAQTMTRVQEYQKNELAIN